MKVKPLRLGMICARGGSKGVKNKNVRLLAGKPLVAHTVEQALKSGMFADLAISSDSDEILDAAMAAGANIRVVRPAELSTDVSGKAGAVLHCAKMAEEITGKRYDTFMDMDATAPLRTPQHIQEAIELLETTQAANIFSVCPARRSPYFNLVEARPDGTVQLCKTMTPRPVRRQDAPQTFDMNASLYCWQRESFFKSGAGVFLEGTRAYVMPEYTLFDLDTEFDFELIEFLYPRVRGLA